MRCEDLFSRRANPGASVDPLPQLLQRAQGRLRPATPVKQRRDMRHDLAPCAHLRYATGAVHEPLAFAWLQTTFDQQKPLLEHVTDVLLALLALTGQAAGHFVCGRRSTALQRGCGRGQAVALGGPSAEETLGQFLEAMEGTHLRGHLANNRADRLSRERRAIRLETPA